ncbi:hypothetical protein HMPREF0083_00147 [Aneurinibacillus aneurinilyticus ATCC 12856]|uniref:Uncharacterized protein n=1 Tax=Aneurinibacillus aneurinilyticus ATCC 12856 TaxID=649747 RepID=U1YLS3_ANEAE|nr:hypothetical protein HMPREF0083_00147 [Aneurinibacillus aneurinilyticus ATCC 12856]
MCPSFRAKRADDMKSLLGTGSDQLFTGVPTVNQDVYVFIW